MKYVTRHGPQLLQNAASIAGLMITTEAVVGELPKTDAPASGHDHDGGMGGMDF